MYTLIKSYLENRCQRVKFNDKLSKWDKINVGVPQGSVLGPLFFLTYITDLPSVILCMLSNKNSSIILFANGTSVIISEPCLMHFERHLNIVFKIIKKWFNSNLLSLNLDRTYYMQFMTKNKSLNKINIEHDNKMIV